MKRLICLAAGFVAFLGLLGSAPSEARLTASISGSIWSDDNGSGQRDPGESGVGGYFVQLIRLETGEVRETNTDPAGGFSFDSLSPGQYQVRVPVGPLWPAYGTYPARQLTGFLEISVAVGTDPISGVAFGVYPGSRVPRFAGDVLVDGAPLASRPSIRAFVGGVECGVETGFFTGNTYFGL